MTHFKDLDDAANVWSDICRSRPNELVQLAYYRFVASRLGELNDRRHRPLR